MTDFPGKVGKHAEDMLRFAEEAVSGENVFLTRLPSVGRLPSNSFDGHALKQLFVLCGVLMLLSALVFACASSTQTDMDGAEGDAESPALSPVTLGQGEKLHVVATTSIVADVVANVGGRSGADIALTGLLPRGTDPHSYEPTPRDLRTVADAHVVFANGAGLEEFLDEMLQNAGGDAAVVRVSRGVRLLSIDGADEDQHEGSDPHVWFDPNNVVVWVQNIEHALSALDPANAEAYAANAQAYAQDLEALDAWIRQQVAQVPEVNRELVTDHRVLAYFADAYGFQQVGAVIPGYSTVAEPSARQLADLEEAIREYDVPAVFVGATVNPRVSARVAEDTGTRLVRFYAGSLSQEDGPADSYLDYMRYNVSQFASALE